MLFRFHPDLLRRGCRRRTPGDVLAPPGGRITGGFDARGDVAVADVLVPDLAGAGHVVGVPLRGQGEQLVRPQRRGIRFAAGGVVQR